MAMTHTVAKDARKRLALKRVHAPLRVRRHGSESSQAFSAPYAIILSERDSDAFEHAIRDVEPAGEQLRQGVERYRAIIGEW